MGKNFKLIVALLVAIFTLPVFGSGVFAEELYTEDGEHTLDYIILKGDANEETGSARYFGETATLTVEDGKKTVSIDFNTGNLIADLSIQNNDTNEITRNEEENTGVLSFELDGELTYPLLLDMTINAGPRGPMHHTVRVFLNVTDVTEIPEEQLEASLALVNEGNKDEEKSEEDTEAEELKEDELNYLILKGDANEETGSARFFGETALLTVEDGKKIVSISFTGGNMIADLAIQNNDTNKITRSEDGETGVLSFELDGELTDPLLLDMTINAGPRGPMYHTVRVFLNVTDVSEIPTEQLEASLALVEEGTKEEEKSEVEPEEPAKETETNKEEVVKGQLDPDKVSEINYVVKHATEDKDSAADRFFTKPGYLLEKNGEKYIQLTVTNSDMIDSLSTDHGEVAIVKENADGSMVVQFKVTDLSKPVIMDMHITVPGMYSQDHSARLIFDEASLTEVDASGYELAESANSNGKAVNPQTGDNTNILLYVLLLIGSAIPLTIMAKRRFA